MGYRSNVTAIVYGSEEALTTYMTKEKLEHGDNSIFTHFKGQLKRITIPFAKAESYALLLEVRDVKWYDDFTHVVAWHRFMDNCEENDCSFEFIRVGEDYDDVDKQEGGAEIDGLLYTSCTIEKDYPQPTKEETL